MVMASGVVVHQCCYRCNFSVQENICFGCNRSLVDSTASKFKRLISCGVRYNPTRFRTTVNTCGKKLPCNVSPRRSQSRVTDDEVNNPEPEPSSNSNSLSVALRRLRDDFRLDGLGMEILSIALPAALALAADPIASLIDTAFIGHIGSAELAAVGVSGAVFNLVSKLFNVPLLNITTSFVAEEQASVTSADDSSGNAREKEKIFLPSVSSAIVLAAALGIIETVALSTGSSFLIYTMGFTYSWAS